MSKQEKAKRISLLILNQIALFWAIAGPFANPWFFLFSFGMIVFQYTYIPELNKYYEEAFDEKTKL